MLPNPVPPTVRPLRLLIFAAALVVIVLLVMSAPSALPAQAQDGPVTTAVSHASNWVVLAWNDLGMHCYNRDFSDLAVLPPFNNLWVQVIKVGDPPQIVTSNVSVSYSFPNNTYSVGKSNFWTYSKKLFGADLAPNIGLTGKGLAGMMEAKTDHFQVDGIPLTEFQDSAPTTPYPYQLATVIAKDNATAVELARVVTVAPVSTEMHCDNCHYDGGVEGIRTGKVETNILTLHDREESGNYPAGFGTLMNNRPVLCATCHASNALGAPGKPGIANLSRAMHSKHADVNGPDSAAAAIPVAGAALPQNFCYNCHPGPQTQCLRDVMSSQFGMTCTDCHGTMQKIASNPDPWKQEPRCDGCHTQAAYKQDQPLYRNSTGHGGVRCSGCHDSPHAIARSTQPNDAIKFITWQGHSGTLSTCTACHATNPTGPGPHGRLAPINLSNFVYMPSIIRPQ